MTELEKGRPNDWEERSEREKRCYDLLDDAGVEYWRADHEAAMTMEVCEEIDKKLGALICKNLFLCNKQKSNFYLLMIPGDKKFKTKDLSAQIGSARLSFAGEEDMTRLLDLKPGSVSVLGLMNDKEKVVKLLIDEEVMEEEWVGCHPCENTSSIKIRVKELVEKVLPKIGVGYTTVKLPRE